MIAWVLVQDSSYLHLILFTERFVLRHMGSPWPDDALFRKLRSDSRRQGCTRPVRPFAGGRIEVRSEICLLASWPHGPWFDPAWMLASARAANGQTKHACSYVDWIA